MANSSCPFCLRALDDPDVEETRDHVFGDALGGRARIAACRDCNSRIGSDVEGPLLKPGTWLAFRREGSQGIGPRFRASIDGGPDVNVDLAKQEHRAVRPVENRRLTDKGLTRTVTGPEPQVRDIVEGMAREHNFDAEEAMANAAEHTASTLHVQLSIDFVAESRLAAKIALAAGTRCLGDAFLASPLADQLRAIVDGHQDPAWRDATPFTQQLEQLGHTVTEAERQCMMMRASNDPDLDGQTLVIIRMLGQTLPTGQVLVVPEPGPDLLVLHEPGLEAIECTEQYMARWTATDTGAAASQVLDDEGSAE
jgi:hypothetical protein